MACCWHEEHDYCCECYDFDDRVLNIVEDALAGTFKHEDSRQFLDSETAF